MRINDGFADEADIHSLNTLYGSPNVKGFVSRIVVCGVVMALWKRRMGTSKRPEFAGPDHRNAEAFIRSFCQD